MCGAVEERSLKRATGGGALSLHLPSPLPDLQDTPQDADRGTVHEVLYIVRNNYEEFRPILMVISN